MIDVLDEGGPVRDARDGSGLLGQDLLALVGDPPRGASARDASLFLATHGHRMPLARATASLGPFDAAALAALDASPSLPLAARGSFAIFGSSLGRLRIRPVGETFAHNPVERVVEIGRVDLQSREIAKIHARVLAVERANHERVRRAVDTARESGALGEILASVADHVEHVEAVGFFVGDAFFCRLERLNNLTTSKRGKGFLPSLAVRDPRAWSDDETLIVAALHALFESGQAVRFEEWNGAVLTATRLWQRLHELLRAYGASLPPRDTDLFALARAVREASKRSVGAEWLRWRWVYGLNFQKREEVLPSARTSEDAAQHVREFAADWDELVGRRPAAVDERTFFYELARAAIARDARGQPCDRAGEAAHGWLEWLIERIVASALLATDSDYAMSSSLRDLACLLVTDGNELDAALHRLTPRDFYTCFVSRGFAALDPTLAAEIVASVQRRMMFNRWHFIPGSLERARIDPGRHWYYPPVLPDIAIHSDVQHAAHARARVKYSVRAPGPDQSQPPLVVGEQAYRGFYDVRVVRMTGPEYQAEDMLRARRRTLWLGHVFAALVDDLHAQRCARVVTGFEVGHWLDIAPRARQAASNA